LNGNFGDSSITDEQLACQSQSGCARSFEELMVRFQVPLLHFLRHRGAGSEAEDLVQDTMVRAYENLHRYQPKWKFGTWIFTIARRLNINHHRRQTRAVGLTSDHEVSLESISSDWPQPEQIVIEDERRQRLWAVAAKVLTEEQNTAMWLHYVEGLPVADIASVLDRSRVSVKAMMFRARKKLLPLVRDMGSGGRLTEESPLMEEPIEEQSVARQKGQAMLSPTEGVSYV